MKTLDFRLENGVLVRTDDNVVMKNTKDYYKLRFDLRTAGLKAAAVHFSSLTMDEYVPLVQNGGRLEAMFDEKFNICTSVDISVIIKTSQSEYETNQVTIQQS